MAMILPKEKSAGKAITHRFYERKRKKEREREAVHDEAVFFVLPLPSSTFETVCQLRAKFSTCLKSCLLILRILLSQTSSSNNFKIKKKKKELFK